MTLRVDNPGGPLSPANSPAIAGITLPGMPAGSPGMVGQKADSFVIYAVTKDGKPPTVYATV